MDGMTPTTHQAMARFRASLLRRASAVAWVVLIIIGAQAVRQQVFTQPGFWIPMAGLAAMLIVSTATRWDRPMADPIRPLDRCRLADRSHPRNHCFRVDRSPRGDRHSHPLRDRCRFRAFSSPGGLMRS